MKGKARNISCDFIRVLALILVIINHTRNKPWAENIYVDSAIQTVIALCNGLFFLLSGKFNLSKEFNTKKDYASFYKKRVIDILMPYVLISMVLSYWNLKDEGIWITPKGYIMTAVQDLFSGNMNYHLWFMFFLIGYIVSTPFLSKMLHAMDNWELHIAFGISVLWQIASVYVAPIRNIGFGYTGWILYGWALYYFAGYYLDRVMDEKNEKYLYIVGALSYLATVIGMIMLGGEFPGKHDYSILFVIFCMSVFWFLQKNIKINNNVARAIILFVAKHSFVMYLIHYNVRWLANPFVEGMGTVAEFVTRVILTFIFSLVIAVVVDLLLDQVKKILTKIMRV